jgi:hypothetical protein
MERFNLRKLYKVEGKEKYHVEVSYRFSALVDLDSDVDINSSWKLLERISEFQPKRA